MKKLMLAVPMAALAIAVPASAKQSAGPATHHSNHGTHHAKSHKCTAHHRSYVASGTLTSWSLTKNSDGTYSGSLSVDVKRGNRHAKSAEGTTTTYTVSDARVHFGKKVSDPPADGSRIKLYGRVAKCSTDTGTSPSVKIRRINVRAPKTKSTSGSTSSSS